MDFETIILKKEKHIATLTLNRPEIRNSINLKMETELMKVFQDIGEDPDVRVMILTGAGKGFCAGADVREPRYAPDITIQEISRILRQIYKGTTLRLYNLEIPTIAMVNGAATGWGLDLALACDIRIGSENAKFGSAFVKLGLTPATGGVWLMPRVTGFAKACELIFTGDLVEAKEAERLGIVNKVAPAEELVKETMALATKIAAAPPMAVKLAKLQLRQGLHTDLESAFELAANCQSICMTSADVREAITAMLEKREPVFKGK